MSIIPESVYDPRNSATLVSHRVHTPAVHYPNTPLSPRNDPIIAELNSYDIPKTTRNPQKYVDSAVEKLFWFITNKSSNDPKDAARSEINILCGVYFFAAWGCRMWEFASIVLLMEVFPTTLLPSSMLGFFESMAAIIGAPYLGRYIDSKERLTSIQYSIIGQNIGIGFASSVLAFSLFHDAQNWSQIYCKVLLVIVLICANMGVKLSSSLNKMSLEKDWAVTIGAHISQLQEKANEGKDSEKISPDLEMCRFGDSDLTQGGSTTETSFTESNVRDADKDDNYNEFDSPLPHINAKLRRVDLICTILAPMGVGLLSGLLGTSMACLIIMAWSLLSMVVELSLSKLVYDRLPCLHFKRNSSSVDQNSPEQQSCRSTLDDIKMFINHPCFISASLPYSMLYLSLLSFGGIMVSFLKIMGCSNLLVGGGRGVAAIIAVLSTIAVPKMIVFFSYKKKSRTASTSPDTSSATEVSYMIDVPGARMAENARGRRAGLVRTALITIWFQVLCLTPLTYAFFMILEVRPAVTTSVVHNEISRSLDGRTTVNIWSDSQMLLYVPLIFFSLCFSRFGLWGFDLSQVQLMQEMVPSDITGKINGMQESLINIFFFGSFCLTIAFPDPASFFIPVIISYCTVLSAAIVFTLFQSKLKL
eukprot:Tbor_TRINITY_DN3838_c0_g1::TRINITY_DN3838_c0_g1_i1::g.5547::m.5547/K14685/SLC40A1, FPN1; solute carrier family 40 (iron-regulated transporter), member 1